MQATAIGWQINFSSTQKSYEYILFQLKPIDFSFYTLKSKFRCQKPAKFKYITFLTSCKKPARNRWYSASCNEAGRPKNIY